MRIRIVHHDVKAMGVDAIRHWLLPFRPLFPKVALRHRPAALRAGAAGRNAGFHASHALAVIGAGLANIRAQRAGLAMKLALMRHHIDGQLADGGAIHHQPEMLRPNMIASHLQALGHGGGKADGVAARGFLDAGTGFGRELVHRSCSWAIGPLNARFHASVPLASIGFRRNFR
jgi:hypothetical protein